MWIIDLFENITRINKGLWVEFAVKVPFWCGFTIVLSDVVTLSLPFG
ncbi:Uncharacterised protein [Vibrio cholerae]|nr:Uncharacterised protein [Vibrio cholerae]CSI64269.1 Uncharacterised protein [Vibrio cholerae]